MIKTALKATIIIGFGSFLLMSSDITWADETPDSYDSELIMHPQNCTCPKHISSERNVELEEDIMETGPVPGEIDKEEYPDYLPGESEVLRVEPGPNLARTEPFVNNPYK